MQISIDNDNIKIEQCTDEVKRWLNDTLSYTDSSKEFQLRRMSRNVFSRNSAYYKKLEASVSGNLVNEDENGIITISSGFANLFDSYNPIDNRKETGVKIALPWNVKPHDLRDYQDEAVSLMCANWRGLINFATGLGKTLTAIHATRRIGRRTLILCPGTSIADNFYKEMVSAFGESRVGYFGDGKKKIKDITIGIAGSVNNHIELFKKHELGLIIVDEVHHIPADTFFTIANALSSVGRMYGLTATDFRSDGKDVMIQAGVGHVLIKRDIIWGIENKWLAYPTIIFRNVNTTGREFPEDKGKNYKEHVLNSDEMNAQLLSDMQKCLAAGKSILCLVDEVEHGKMLAEKLGLPFATGKDKNSGDYVEQLNRGEIPGLIGTDSKIGEGTDTKNVDVLILANFVGSKGPLWQNLGRGLRIHDNKKTVLVLDYCPLGSKMLTRHAKARFKLYKTIPSTVRLA